MYDELVLVQEQYTYSINVQMDIDDDEKLLNYIPNDTSIDLFKNVFVDIIKDKPNFHSRLIYGSYGTGKSHFLTVMSMLASKQYNRNEAFKAFTKRLISKDKELAEDIKTFEKSKEKKPFLIVPIVFDFPDFNRCIYFSLKKTLFKHGINITFKTFYDQANSVVRKWLSNPTSADTLRNICRKNRTTPEKLQDRLGRMEPNIEKKFMTIFSEMTYGVEFVYEVSNLSDAIEQVNKATHNQYSGIIFIFDEFGRYMEDNLHSFNINSVQALTEFCDHSDWNNHLILVSHKELSQYTKELGTKTSDKWKKIEGRFCTYTMNSQRDQSLFFAGNVLAKNHDIWQQFSKKFSKQLDKIYTEASDFGGYDIDANLDSNPFADSFPLHPISLFALEKLSKKVAQNERTFFTFLSGKAEGALYSFLCRTDINEFHVVGIDLIYDYFEPSIKSMKSDNTYEWYKKLQIALNKLPKGVPFNSYEIKILKAITIIAIIGMSNVLPASKEIILCAIDGPDEDKEIALSNLISNKIIKYSGTLSAFDFYNASSINIDELIDENISNATDESIIKTLNDEFVDFVIYPHLYNNEYKISRVFAPVFFSAKLSHSELVSRINKLECDGTVVMMLANHDDINELIEVSTRLPSSIIFINTDCNELISATRKYISLKFLDSTKDKYINQDPIFEQELNYCLAEQSSIIKNLISNWSSFAVNSLEVVFDGKLHSDIANMSQLNNLASLIMKQLYPLTLIVNNELVNKNSLTGSMSSARKMAIRAILSNNSDEKYFGLTDLSPEYIFVRSVLAKNDFYHDPSISAINVCDDGVVPQNEINNVFKRFWENARKSPVSFDRLLTELTAPHMG